MRREMQRGQALDSSAQPEHPLPARRRHGRPRWDETSVISALRAWAAEHDGLAPRFNDWHADQHPDYAAGPERFPAAMTVMKLFGTWQSACAAAGVQVRPRRKPPVRDVPWPQPRIVAALRAWAVEHDGLAPRVGDWHTTSIATGGHPDYVADPGRWPSAWQVVNAFGSWQAACDAAGLSQRPARSEKQRWSREQIVEALQAWAVAHDGYAPRTRDWHQSPPSHPDRTRACTRWPSETTIRRHFGTWHAACTAAGVQPQPRPWPRTSWTRGSIITALRDWAAEHDGHAPRASDWQAAYAHPDFLADRHRWPATTTVIRRFGSWSTACTEANVSRPSPPV